MADATALLTGLLLLTSIGLGLAQWRGYRPLEAGISRLRGRLGQIRSQEEEPPRSPDHNPRGSAETDGGSPEIGEIEEIETPSQIDSDSSDRSSQVDRRERGDTWSAPEAPAPIRPIRAGTEQEEKVVISAPEGVEIEIRRESR